MNLKKAKDALDKVIKKSRVHLYKPIQIAEILYRDRIFRDINILDLETYRCSSRKWRDDISNKFIGRSSTSSARYQDDVFNKNATPPNILHILAKENREKSGIVEAYIYKNFSVRQTQMIHGLSYCKKSSRETFNLVDFLNLFWAEPGLRRSIDKIYETIVYSLFSVLVEELKITVEVALDLNKIDLLKEFNEFAKKVISIDSENPSFKTPARLYRVGVTNAADRGLDMWANFGPAIQIKHLALNEELAENIVDSVTADRIVIVCKESDAKLILSIVNQLGWKSRIQSIITEDDLIKWYEKALRGKYGNILGDKLLETLCIEIENEFPSSNTDDFKEFVRNRGYDKLSDCYWSIVD